MSLSGGNGFWKIDGGEVNGEGLLRDVVPGSAPLSDRSVSELPKEIVVVLCC